VFQYDDILLMVLED